jgi:hypothetical protein
MKYLKRIFERRNTLKEIAVLNGVLSNASVIINDKVRIKIENKISELIDKL